MSPIFALKIFVLKVIFESFERLTELKNQSSCVTWCRKKLIEKWSCQIVVLFWQFIFSWFTIFSVNLCFGAKVQNRDLAFTSRDILEYAVIALD